MTTVQVTPDTQVHDAECVGCGAEAPDGEGFCRACWLGVDAADDAQRLLDEALAAIGRVVDLLGELEDQERVAAVSRQANRVAAASANLRLAVTRKWCRL
jgi:hypothetical protein